MSTRRDMCDFCDETKEVTPNDFSNIGEGEGTSLICQDCLENKIEEYKIMLQEFDQIK